MRGVLAILRALFFGWLFALIDLWRGWLLARRRRRERGDRTVSGQGSRAHCVPIDHPAFRRPDPLIYDQYYLMGLGLAVTWDNPDITLLHHGAPVSPHSLEPDTVYEVQVRVWNASTDAWVVKMPVHLSYLDFGIGTVSVDIDTQKVSVGVKGSASQPNVVSFAWRTPPVAGHYCLQALLDPADDANFANNLGQLNTDVGVAHSPATFTFALRNASRREHTHRFRADAYALGSPVPCPREDGDAERDPERSRRREGQRRARLAKHRREDHPVPPGWTVVMTPAEPVLAPGAAVTVEAVVTPPSGWTGQQNINVNAVDEADVLAGGVTLTVRDGMVP